ncbi:MAG: hypothetical protein V8Q40_13710 [Anaerosacchariphilus sp.]
MKNKVLKKVLVLMMCGALAVPAAGVTRPMVAHATAGTPAVQAGPTGGAGAGVTTGTEKTQRSNWQMLRKMHWISLRIIMMR